MFQVLFAGLFASVEGWDYGLAFYHCMVTATTVGYGDVSIETQGGRVLATVHILLSVCLLGAVLSDIDTLRQTRKRLFQRREDKPRTREVTTRRPAVPTPQPRARLIPDGCVNSHSGPNLHADGCVACCLLLLPADQLMMRMVDIDLITSLDLDGQGVDKFEFVVGMLHKLEMIDWSEVASPARSSDAALHLIWTRLPSIPPCLPQGGRRWTVLAFLLQLPCRLCSTMASSSLIFASR